jgi:hypothetical protein
MPEGRELLMITYHGRVFFEGGSTTLRPSGHEELGRVAKVLSLFPDMAIHVEVRLDTGGLPANTHRLKQVRVQAVKNALLEQGVDPSGVQTTIHRASHTVSADDTISVRLTHSLMASYGQTQASYHGAGQSYRQAC